MARRTSREPGEGLLNQNLVSYWRVLSSKFLSLLVNMAYAISSWKINTTAL